LPADLNTHAFEQALNQPYEARIMTIQPGHPLPAASFKQLTAIGVVDISTDELLKGKKVALFGLPGAYTPVCSASHLPGYVENANKLRAAGFDTIACVSVNDPFVMDAWGRATGADGKVLMLADADGSFTKAIGLAIDLPAFGLTGRSERYSMVVEDGVVAKLEVEKSVLDHDGSSAACMLRA
jgi:glutaredoxin/glutathione-dependent peroxiredoxin